MQARFYRFLLIQAWVYDYSMISPWLSVHIYNPVSENMESGACMPRVRPFWSHVTSNMRALVCCFVRYAHASDVSFPTEVWQKWCKPIPSFVNNRWIIMTQSHRLSTISSVYRKGGVKRMCRSPERSWSTEELCFRQRFIQNPPAGWG